MNPVLFVFLSVLLYSGLQHSVEGNAAAEKERIVRELQTRGHKLVPPNGEAGDGSPVVVTLDFTLIRILEVDEVKGWLKLSAYLSMSWKDPRMAFSGHNISTVALDASDVWTPDIELYHPDVDGMKVVTQKHLVIVYENGNMIYVPSVIIGSFCDQTPGYFHSAMNCTARLGSWIYSGEEVDVQLSSPMPDTTSYTPSGRWTLASSAATRKVKTYACCSEPYVSVDYTFQVVWQ